MERGWSLDPSISLIVAYKLQPPAYKLSHPSAYKPSFNPYEDAKAQGFSDFVTSASCVPDA